MTAGEKVMGFALLVTLPATIYLAGSEARAVREREEAWMEVELAEQGRDEALEFAQETVEGCYYPKGWEREQENMIFDCTQEICAVNGWQCRSHLCSEVEEDWLWDPLWDRSMEGGVWPP